MDKIIHEDIRKASTLPSKYCLEQEYFESAKEKIFARTWQLLEHTDNVRLTGQLHPLILLQGFLDEPLLLVRDKDDKLNCLSNVCTHRGNLLVENTCIEQNIRCRYHGRRFNLHGKFQSMPEFEEVENFPSEQDNLPKIPFGQWGKFVFTSLQPIISLEEAIGEMKQRIGWMHLNEYKFDAVCSRDYLVKCNWALYCENYLEGFHIPYIHNSLSGVLDYSAYKTEIYKYSNLQLAIGKDGEDVFDLPKASPDYGKKITAYYYWVFPNTMFNFYPWGLSINIVRPLATSLCKVSFLTYIYDETKLDTGAGAMLDKVQREDEVIVENVQKGIRSRFYDTGKYSPKREQGTHHLHRLMMEFMNK